MWRDQVFGWIDNFRRWLNFNLILLQKISHVGSNVCTLLILKCLRVINPFYITFLRGWNETAKVFHGIKKYQNISLEVDYQRVYDFRQICFIDFTLDKINRQYGLWNIKKLDFVQKPMLNSTCVSLCWCPTGRGKKLSPVYTILPPQQLDQHRGD